MAADGDRVAADAGDWERRREIAGIPLFWREATRPAAAGEGPPVLYLHGVPTNSDDYLPFLERTGGIAPDLPGFGRSGKPAGFDYSIPGYSRFIEAFLREVAPERFSLVVHDWGAVGLALASPLLARLDRVAILNALPLSADYRWHRIARVWRTPVAGELAMGFSTRWGLKRASGEAFVEPGPAPDRFIDRVWDHFDHGTQRAILKLYRSAPPEELGRGGARLGEIRCPALVLWGALDPYIPRRFADVYAGALGGTAEVELLDDAGHWPWIDQPAALDRVARFLTHG